MGGDETAAAVRLELLGSHVAAITIDRVEHRNALTRAMFQRLSAFAQECEQDESIRVIILRGSGRWFCSGADIGAVDLKAQPGGPPPIDFESYFFTPLLRMTKPLIAQVNGAAAGGGLGLALACDMRIAAQSAIFATSFLRIGVTAHDMVTWLLPRVVGLARSFELLYQPGKISSARALDIGLVSEVWPDAELADRTLALAANIASLAPHALRLTKRLLLDASSRTAAEHMMAQEYSAMANRMVAGHDIAEGAAAFVAKRQPDFVGPR